MSDEERKKDRDYIQITVHFDATQVMVLVLLGMVLFKLLFVD